MRLEHASAAVSYIRWDTGCESSACKRAHICIHSICLGAMPALRSNERGFTRTRTHTRTPSAFTARMMDVHMSGMHCNARLYACANALLCWLLSRSCRSRASSGSDGIRLGVRQNLSGSWIYTHVRVCAYQSGGQLEKEKYGCGVPSFPHFDISHRNPHTHTPHSAKLYGN